MKNPEREKNLKSIQALHRALRYAACGAIIEEFAERRLDHIACELRARIEVEELCIKMDEPSYFMELVQKGKDVVLRKMQDEEETPKGQDLN